MPEEQYIYQDRAVVFLDVLGFQEKLKLFQKEAEENKVKNNSEFFTSSALDEFIDTFKSVVSFLDEKNYRYYLFSDNICITVDYINNHNNLIETLVTINDLFIKFAQKGYFLRGGLDVGKFVDEKDIAVGIPLANAYKLEQDAAIFPRIVISEAYKNLLDAFEESQLLSADSITIKNYIIKQHCEIFYLNAFTNLLNNENKIELLEILKAKIEQNIFEAAMNEKVAIKYEWLAKEFNEFIDYYTNELMFLESDNIPDASEIKRIESLKII